MRVVAAVLIFLGSYAVAGIIIILIDFSIGLLVVVKRRFNISPERKISTEIFICKTLAMIGILVAMLGGPLWTTIGGTRNIIEGIEFGAFSLHRAGATILGFSMICFAFILRYDMGRTLDFMKKADMPHTRLMINLILMLFFTFGVLLIIHELMATALIGLICVWSAMTISIIPMWRTADEGVKAEKMLHLIANVTVIGGLICLLGIHNSRM